MFQCFGTNGWISLAVVCQSEELLLVTPKLTWCISLDQVLLSQSHRYRALVLLGRFLDMGAWAVDQVFVSNLMYPSCPRVLS